MKKGGFGGGEGKRARRTRKPKNQREMSEQQEMVVIQIPQRTGSTQQEWTEDGKTCSVIAYEKNGKKYVDYKENGKMRIRERIGGGDT